MLRASVPVCCSQIDFSYHLTNGSREVHVYSRHKCPRTCLDISSPITFQATRCMFGRGLLVLGEACVLNTHTHTHAHIHTHRPCGPVDQMLVSVTKDCRLESCHEYQGFYVLREPVRNRTCGLVAMTSAPHAEGRQFDPGQVYFSISIRLVSQQASLLIFGFSPMRNSL